MSAREIGSKLVALCREGKNIECIESLYADDVESVEAADSATFPRVIRGKANVLEKNVQWGNANDIHSAGAEGPYPHGDDKFAVRFTYDITNRESKQRMAVDEIAVFHLRAGKIVREEFFYDIG